MEAPNPEVAIIDRVRLRLEPDRSAGRDRKGLLQHFTVAGAVGNSPLAVGGILDGHLDRVPVPWLVVLEFLIGPDTGVVANLELVLELVVTEVETAVGVPAGENSKRRMKSPANEATVSIASILGWPGRVAPVDRRSCHRRP